MLVHGCDGHSLRFIHLAEFPTAQGFRVVAMNFSMERTKALLDARSRELVTWACLLTTWCLASV